MGRGRSGFKRSAPPPDGDCQERLANHPGLIGRIEKEERMTTLMISFLLLSTIVAAFVFGIAAGYWVILGILHFFHPARVQRRTTRAHELAPTGGD